MTVRVDDDQIVLEGDCHVEEAETLLGLLESGRPVNWTMCRHLHGAVLQVLLSLRPTVVGTPEGEFLARWIAPAIRPES